MPDLVLWAWERPENLEFIDVRTTGVAALEATAVFASDGSMRLRMRTAALALPPGTQVLATTRIETPPVHAPLAIEPLLSALLDVAKLPGICGLQIDFDARHSERLFYRAVLSALHERTLVPVSITALASWCAGDQWIARGQIAEAVPMFFRMGLGESRDMQIKSPLCRQAIGMSTDEPWPAKRPVGVKRIYLFTPRRWTRDNYALAVREVLGWK